MRLKSEKIITSVLAGIMTLTAVAAVASADGGMMGGDGMMGGQAGNGNGGMGGNHMWNWSEQNMWQDGMGYMHGHDGNAQEHMQWMMQECRKMGIFSLLSYSDGVADGYFISFLLNESTGTVSEYNMKTGTGSVEVFDSITIAGFDPYAPRVQGAVMLLNNETVQTIIHDNPTGMFHVVANNTPTAVSFKLAEGVSVSQVILGSEDAPLGNREAVIVSKDVVQGVITTDDGSLTVESGDAGTFVNITFVDDHAMFRARPVFAHGNMNNNQAVLQAVVQDRIGCEISLMVRDGSTMYEVMEYQHQFRLRVLDAERNRITLQVSSEDPAGKVVLMTMDRQTLETRNAELAVMIDGVAVAQTSNPLDVLYASGSAPEDAVFTVLQDGETSQFLVYVPSFSTHSLSIESVVLGADLLGLAGIVAVIGAVAVVGVASVMLFRRKG